MNPDPIRWVVMKGHGGDYQIFSGPWTRLEAQDIPEQERLGYETVGVVDTEEEATNWIEIHKSRQLT